MREHCRHLPEDHVDPLTKKLVKKFDWSSASQVTPEVRKKLEKVEWTLLPGMHPQVHEHSVRLQAPVQRYVLFSVKKELRGLGGYILRDTFETVLRVPDYTPELLFMSQGSILTLSGDKKIPVLSRNVRQIKYEVGRVLPSHTNLLISRIAQSGSFSKPDLYGDIEDSLSERFEEIASVSVKERSMTNYTSLNLNNYIKNGRGFYYVKAYRHVESGSRYQSQSGYYHDDSGEDGEEGSDDYSDAAEVSAG